MFGIPNPNRLLQPFKSLRQFSEELYAMLSSQEPVEREGPVTIRVQEGQTALRLVRSEETPAPAPQRTLRARPIPDQFQPPAASRIADHRPDWSRRGSSQSESAPSKKVRPQVPGSHDEPTSAPKKHRPIMEVDGGIDFKGPDPVRFDTPPLVWSEKHRDYRAPNPSLFEPPAYIPDDRAFLVNPGSGGLWGFVNGGTGPSWSVTLYPDGPAGAVGETVTVTIPTIDPDEEAPADAWISPITQFGSDDDVTYYYQPAVWL